MTRLQAVPALLLLPLLAAAAGATSSGQSAAQDPSQAPALAPAPALEVHRELLPLPGDPARQVELFWVAPGAGGPRLAMLMVHGHQEGERPGARIYLEPPILVELAAAGYVAAAVSQPGYGDSDGPADFCGPLSQQAVGAAVEALRGKPEVRGGQVVLYGHSRGAITASMVAIHDPGLAGAVLGGGVYDMAEAWATLPDDSGIKQNIERETGATPEAFAARSALLAATVSSVPTLLLHGEQDLISPVEGARRLAERLRAAGTFAELVTWPDFAHRIPWEEKKPVILRFLARVAGEAPP